MNWLTNNAIWIAFSFVILIAFLHADNAKGDALFVGAWSEHLISGEDLNEQHDLAAIEYGGWFAGRFENSYGRESYAVAKSFEWSGANLRAGVYVGAVRGYTRCWGNDDSNTDVCPLAVPYVTYDAAVAPQLMLIGEALAITIRIRL